MHPCIASAILSFTCLQYAGVLQTNGVESADSWFIAGFTFFLLIFILTLSVHDQNQVAEKESELDL